MFYRVVIAVFTDRAQYFKPNTFYDQALRSGAKIFTCGSRALADISHTCVDVLSQYNDKMKYEQRLASIQTDTNIYMGVSKCF
jgi:hypothetical protein